MTSQYYAIDQRIVLATGEIQNYLVVKLPNGKETRAPIDLGTTKELLEGAEMSEVRNAAPPPAAPPEPPPQAAGEPPAPAPPAEDEQLIEWALLPEGVMHPLMKAALRRLQVAEKLPLSQLTALVEQINERFGPEDWEDLQAEAGAIPPAPPPSPAAAPPPPPAAPIGGIRWADGRPIVPGTMSRGRTVQKDDMGYPVPQDGEVDPGELVGGVDTDEDGVGQL